MFGFKKVHQGQELQARSRSPSNVKKSIKVKKFSKVNKLHHLSSYKVPVKVEARNKIKKFQQGQEVEAR